MPTATEARAIAVRSETELSVVVPNEPGQLARLTGALSAAGVNLSGMMCVHAGDTARVKLTTEGSSESARRWLERSGYAVSAARVLMLEAPAGSDLPHRVAEVLASAGINILSCHGQETRGVLRLVVSADRPEAAEEVLSQVL